MMQDLIFRIVVIVGPLILAVSVHEFAHIATARWLGDDLGTRLGRYTLDPLKHIDPIWTVALPVFLVAMSTLSGGSALPFFAAGKPAPYNPNALNKKIFKKRISMRKAELLIAAAGPFSNLLLAFISVIIAVLLLKTGHHEIGSVSIVGLLVRFVYLNIALFVFNLIPVPPLDGSKVLASLLPAKLAYKYQDLSPNMTWILFGLLIFGGSSIITIPVHYMANSMLSLFI